MVERRDVKKVQEEHGVFLLADAAAPFMVIVANSMQSKICMNVCSVVTAETVQNF